MKYNCKNCKASLCAFVSQDRETDCNTFIGEVDKKRKTDDDIEEYSEKKEMVNHPKHYGGDTTYECIKVLKAWLPEEQYKGFLRGNALKYLCRVGNKDETKQELNKAKWYLEKLIECYE